MKKIVVLVLFVIILSQTVFAIGGIGFFADFTTVSMGKANDKVQSIANNWTGGVLSPSISSFNSGILAGICANASILPAFDLGLRAGYLYAFPASAKLSFSDIYGDSVNYSTQYNASLIPVEIGLIYKYNIPSSPISLGVGLYAGYGFANADMDMKTSGYVSGYGAFSSSVDVPVSGGCFVTDILVNGTLSFGNSMSLGLDLGYRIADVPQLKATDNISNPFLNVNIKEGDVIKENPDNTGSVVSADFGGLIVGLKFSIGF